MVTTLQVYNYKYMCLCTLFYTRTNAVSSPTHFLSYLGAAWQVVCVPVETILLAALRRENKVLLLPVVDRDIILVVYLQKLTDKTH